jgi:hypothetical protein
MAVKIPSNQIQNLQQIEVVVAGPDDANRLFIIDGQFDSQLTAFSQGAAVVSKKENFTPENWFRHFERLLADLRRGCRLGR